jgi:outer membrane protein
MKKIVLALMIAALSLPMMAQTGAPSKIAVINVQRVFLESNLGKAAKDRLEKAASEKQARGKKMQEELEALDKEIAAKRLSLSPDKLTELQKSYDQKKIELQRFAQDADRDLKQEEQKVLMELEKAIRPVIDQLGKEMGFAAIFNKMESGLVYASDAIDVTDLTIKRFNEANPTAAAPAAAPAPPTKK